MKLFYIDPQSYNNLSIYDTELLRNIHDVDIVYFCNVKYQCQEVAGIDYRKIFNYSDKHGLSKAICYISSIVRIGLAAFIERPNIVHIQWFRLFYIDCILVSLLRMLKIKIVHTAHNVLPHNHSTKDISHYSWYYRHSDSIIVHDERSKTELTQMFSLPKERIQVIPHGLLPSSACKKDVTKRLAEIKTQLSLEGKTIFGVLGFQNYYKGIDIISDVWSSTPELNGNINIKLLVIGKTENVDLSDLKKNKNVYVKDEMVSDIDFDAFLEASSVLLLPYRKISQSGVLLTALQRRKPVVVSDIGGLTEPFKYGNVGWNIGEPNHENLRKVLLSLSKVPQEIEKRVKDTESFDKISKAFSWENIGRKTLNLYKSSRMLCILLCTIIAVCAFSQNNSHQDVKVIDPEIYRTVTGINLPVIQIETENQEEPTYEIAEHPEGQGGLSIKNETKVPGRIVITLLNDTLYDSKEYIEDESGMKIKIRGNTSSAGSDKPCYKIKLQKKADLLFRGSNDYADSEWLLLKERNLKMKEGFMINELLGMPWTPRYQYVNVIMNGVYRGWYVLCESIKRNTKCRVDVEKSGFIFEYDVYWWNEDFYLPSSFFRFNYTMKYPDKDNITEEQAETLQDIIDKFEKDVYTPDSAANSIDMRSFAAWMLGQDILGNSDGAGSNMILMKKDDSDSTRVKMVTLWDFDGAEDMVDTLSNSNGNHLWWPLVHKQPSFVKEYVKVWDEVSPTIFDTVISRFSEYNKSAEAEALDSTRMLKKWVNNWPDTCSVSKDVERVTAWLTRRKTYLTQAIDSLYRNIDAGIREVTIDPYYTIGNTPSNSYKVFDMRGIRVNANSYKGLVIFTDSNGRKRKLLR